MTVAKIWFGAIKRDGEDLPAKRHGFTADLVGKMATWHYANGFVNTHIYYDANYYRIKVEQTPPPNPAMSSFEKELAEKRRRRLERTGFSTSPPSMSKSTRDLYLISFIEENLNKANPKKGGSNFLVLINIKEGFDVCRSFTHTFSQIPEWGLSKAYGDVVEDRGMGKPSQKPLPRLSADFKAWNKRFNIRRKRLTAGAITPSPAQTNCGTQIQMVRRN